MEDRNAERIDPKIGQKSKEMLHRHKRAVFERFPLLFTLLGAFGLVATFYGFERIIDRIHFFSNNPFILLGTGIVVLLFTGTLYQKLGQ